MARPEWQSTMVEEFRKNPQIRLSTLAQKFGRHPASVRAVLLREGLTPPTGQRGFRSLTQCPPLSVEHRRLGIRVTLFRGERAASEVAAELGISHTKLRMLELGVWDVPLSVLQRVAELCETDVHELTQPMKAVA